MRVLMISKACIVGIYQRKLELIGQADDIELRVLVPPSWKDERGETKLERVFTDGYELVETPINLNGNFHLHHYPNVNKEINDFQPDIIHIDEEPYNLATWLILRSALRTNAKTLFFSWQNINRRYPLPFRWMEQYVLKNVHYALVGTQSSAAVWREKGYKGQLSVVPQFGVDIKLFEPRGNEDESLDENYDVQLGYAGRLVEEKGVDLLLKALKPLKHLHWQLTIIGGGPQQAELEKLAADLGISDRVTFTGLVESVEMPKRLRDLDVLVIPSQTRNNWKEQYGRVIIEAMASEVAVIGSDSGAIPNVIGSAGLIFPEQSVKALTHEIERVVQDRQLRIEIQKAGRLYVMENFTQEQVANRTAEIYRDLVGEVQPI